MSITTSVLKVEKVVNDPISPVPILAVNAGEINWLLTVKAVRKPRKKDPITFTSNVPIGKSINSNVIFPTKKRKILPIIPPNPTPKYFIGIIPRSICKETPCFSERVIQINARTVKHQYLIDQVFCEGTYGPVLVLQ